MIDRTWIKSQASPNTKSTAAVLIITRFAVIEGYTRGWPFARHGVVVT